MFKYFSAWELIKLKRYYRTIKQDQRVVTDEYLNLTVDHTDIDTFLEIGSVNNLFLKINILDVDKFDGIYSTKVVGGI